MDYKIEERVVWHGAHRIIADTGWYCSAKPGWVIEQRIESAIAAVIKVDVYATVVIENKVPNGVGSFDGVRVGVESF
jgi:hypothetical protein